jgi:ATP-dependent DNA helicase MPH1
VLLAEGREEANWNKAREAYNDVQRSIVRGEQLELYEDVERLLPDHIKPQCLEMVMDIEEYDRSAAEKSRERVTQEPSKKRKRNDDPTRDIPSGACTGFVSVAELLEKQKVKKRKKTTKFDEHAGLDDDTDEEIEAGLFAPRRAASASAASVNPPKSKLKRAKTTAGDGKKRKSSTSNQAKVRKAADSTEMTITQFSRQGAEDSDDMEIERGVRNTSLPSPNRSPPSPMRTSSPDIPLAENQSIIDICTSAAPSRSPSPRNQDRGSTPTRPSGNVPAPEHRSPSPLMSPIALSDDAAPELDQEIRPVAEEREVVVEDDSLAWLLADSDDAGEVAGSPAAQRRQRSGSQPSDTIEFEEFEPENEPPIVLTSSPVQSHAHGSPKLPNRGMPPPALPPPPRLRLGPDAAAPVPVAPSPSLPIRPGGFRAKKAMAQVADPSSSPLHPPPPSQKRLYRRDHRKDDDSDSDSRMPPSPTSAASPPRLPPPRKRRKRGAVGRRLKVRDTAEAALLIPWIDVEAGHSGDDVSSGIESPCSRSEESESDRLFAADFQATQPSPSYDQSAVYRQSLLSQAPVPPGNGFGNNNRKRNVSVPMFAAPPVRRGAPLRLPARTAAAAGGGGGGHERVARSSSPVPPDEEDYYMLGSFVVDDDAEISFMQSSDP